MTHRDIYEFIKQNIPCKSAAGGRQLVTICPFPDCNDKSGHMYIGPFDNSDSPIRYNCFKCNHSGLVTPKFFSMYGIYADDFNKAITEFIANAPKYINNKTNSIRSFNIVNDYISFSNITDQKLAYINNRLGSNLTYQDCIDLKIVLNLYDLLARNNIDRLTRDKSVVDILNNHFVGFLSSDNNNVNMRNIRDPGVLPEFVDERYINYRIFNTKDSCKYYMIPTSIDLTSPLPIDVFIAEGVFDILGVYLNITNRNRFRTLYTNISGKGYTNLIEYLLCNLGLSNINLHICPDADVTDYEISEIEQFIRPFNFNVYIHRNIYKDSKTGKYEKDFGVPPSRIIDSCIQIQKRNEY